VTRPPLWTPDEAREEAEREGEPEESKSRGCLFGGLGCLGDFAIALLPVFVLVMIVV